MRSAGKRQRSFFHRISSNIQPSVPAAAKVTYSCEEMAKEVDTATAVVVSPVKQHTALPMRSYSSNEVSFFARDNTEGLECHIAQLTINVITEHCDPNWICVHKIMM